MPNVFRAKLSAIAEEHLGIDEQNKSEDEDELSHVVISSNLPKQEQANAKAKQASKQVQLPPETKKLFDEKLQLLLLEVKNGNVDQILKIFEEVQQQLKSDSIIYLPLLVNEYGPSGWCLIHFAAYYNRINILRLLLSLNVDVNLITKDGWTPLQIAINKGHLEGTETYHRYTLYCTGAP